MRTGTAARPGYALVVALIGILAAGTAVTLGFYSAADGATGTGAAERRDALDRVSTGLEHVIGDWDVLRLAAVGRDTTFLVAQDGGSVAMTIERTGTGTFRIVATAAAEPRSGRSFYCTRTVPARLHRGRLIAAPERQDHSCRML
jgi:hypothetical protein